MGIGFCVPVPPTFSAEKRGFRLEACSPLVFGAAEPTFDGSCPHVDLGRNPARIQPFRLMSTAKTAPVEPVLSLSSPFMVGRFGFHTPRDLSPLSKSATQKNKSSARKKVYNPAMLGRIIPSVVKGLGKPERDGCPGFLRGPVRDALGRPW